MKAEKEVLEKLTAARRLHGWCVHDGRVEEASHFKAGIMVMEWVLEKAGEGTNV